MARQIEETDNSQLEVKLRDWLESAPLYSEYRYMRANSYQLPNDIRMFCEQCERMTTWRSETHRNQFPSDKSHYQQRSYRCANCKDQQTYFCYSWYDEPNKGTIDGKPVAVSVLRKHGQWPAIEERVKKELEKALEGTEDLRFYKTALRLRNFGNGIGAMSYMRRVIENHTNEMIDILKEEAEKGGHGEGVSKQQIPSRFVDKVDYAARLFPASITPQNYPNPIKPLYILASDALHNLSESEAVATFDECRKVFEYVFSSLRPALSERRKFLNSLQAVTQLSATRAEPSKVSQ